MNGYVHNLSPFAIQLTETIGIRWYGLAYLAGFILGYLIVVQLVKRGGSQFQLDQVGDFITICAIGVLAGGRIGYSVFYSPDLFVSFSSQFPYWGVLKVNEGGMSSHGGMFGVLLSCWWYSHRSRKKADKKNAQNPVSFWHCVDVIVFGASLGFFFGRIANFINGELYGREATAGLSWAVRFPQEMFVWVQKEFPRLASLSPAVEALREFKSEAGQMIAVNSQAWISWLAAYPRDFSARVKIHEGLEGLVHAVQLKNEAVTAALAPVLTPRYPSQLIQSVLEGLLVFLILVWIWRKPQKPGVISGWFGVLYCLARIVGEQFRMPDAHIGFEFLGLTRGQWISIGFLVFASIYLLIAYRSPHRRMGGWNPTKT